MTAQPDTAYLLTRPESATEAAERELRAVVTLPLAVEWARIHAWGQARRSTIIQLYAETHTAFYENGRAA